MTARLYGIPNCDTVKKARTWLDTHHVAFEFNDFKKAGVDTDALDRWLDALGWEVVLNRAGTTFRKLPDADKADLDRAKVRALLLANPSAIKRPIVEHDGGVTAGFTPERYAALFGGGG